MPAWFVPVIDALSRSSNWTGAGAAKRMMNILSPRISDGEFKRRVKWVLDRGCDHVHLILNNAGDGPGDGAGYGMYGAKFTWQPDKGFIKLALERMRYCRRKGLGVVVWAFTDDSGAMNREAAKNFEKAAADIHRFKLDRYASGIVCVLESKESYTVGQVHVLANALRRHCGLPAGTHENSGYLKYAGCGDFVMYQTSPGLSIDQLKGEARKVDAAVGKPWWYFELERQEARDKCAALMEFGKILKWFRGVGNW